MPRKIAVLPIGFIIAKSPKIAPMNAPEKSAVSIGTVCGILADDATP